MPNLSAKRSNFLQDSPLLPGLVTFKSALRFRRLLMHSSFVHISYMIPAIRVDFVSFSVIESANSNGFFNCTSLCKECFACFYPLKVRKVTSIQESLPICKIFRPLQQSSFIEIRQDIEDLHRLPLMKEVAAYLHNIRLTAIPIAINIAFAKVFSEMMLKSFSSQLTFKLL